MYSHEELISAVSAAGRDGKTFTVKDVRTQLGFDSRDKKELSRFRRRLRAFEKAAADQLEKLGNNSYRLRSGAFEETLSEAEEAPPAASATETNAAPVEVAADEPAAEPAAEPGAEPAAAIAPETEASPVEVAANEPVAQPAAATAPETGASPVEVVANEPVAQPAAATAPETNASPVDIAARVAVAEPASTEQEPEVPLEPASGVFQSAAAANEPEAQPQPVREAPALHVVEPAAEPTSNVGGNAHAAYSATPPLPHDHSASTPQRVLSVAGALVSSAFAASAAVSGKVRERGRNLREQLWSCVRSGPARKHALARLRGWAESVRPLSNEVREQLSALRQRVLAGRRRAA